MIMIVVVIVHVGGARPLLAEQGLTVLDRDPVVVGMDLREGQEAVAVAAVLDEGCLERRFEPGDPGEVDATLELLLGGGLAVAVLEAVPVDNHDPSLFRSAERRVGNECVRTCSSRRSANT